MAALSALCVTVCVAMLALQPHAVTGQQEIPCGYDAGTATFSLGEQESAQPIIALEDARNNGYEGRFKYLLGLCQNIMEASGVGIPQKCRDIIQANGGVSALQYLEYEEGGDQTCNAIGGHIAPGKNISWQLLNPQDPSAGVSLRYVGGDACTPGPDETTGQTFNRAVSIDFICADRAMRDVFADVVEDVACRYHIILRGRVGCPTECPRVQSSGIGSHARVCNGTGVCRYNSKKQTPQCYCDQGWSGPDCTKKVSSSSSQSTTKKSTKGSIVGGLFGGIFLGLFIGVGVYYYLFVYKKGSQGGDDNQSSQARFTGGTSSAYVPPSNDEDNGGESGRSPLL